MIRYTFVLTSLFLSAVALADNVGSTSSGSGNISVVRVVAFDTRGLFLGPPEISRFDSQNGKNIASAFHNGTAEHIPFGRYVIEARLAGYYSETRFVDVYLDQVTVIVGLPVGIEAPLVPTKLRGNVTGATNLSKTFVKLVGVYSAQSIESSLSASGDFELAGAPSGAYMLMLISDKGIVLTRVITIPQQALLQLKVPVTAR